MQTKARHLPALALLLAITALAATPALRVLLAVGLTGHALWQARQSSWRLPSPPSLFWPWLVTLGLAFASLAWSVAPRDSLRAAGYDLLLPAALFWLGYRYGGNPQARRYLASGMLLGLLAMWLLSLGVVLTQSGVALPLPTRQAAGFVLPVPRWYGGMGEASTWLICMAPPTLLACVLAGKRFWRRVWWLALFILLLSLAASTNRLAWFALLAGGVPFLPRLAARLGWKRLLALVGLAVAVVGASLTWSLQYRAQQMQLPAVHGNLLVKLEAALARDNRPVIWTFWWQQGLQNPWMGVGYGKWLPHHAYGANASAAQRMLDPNFASHAHNALFNRWLQLGWFGALVWLWLYGALTWRLWRQSANTGPAGYAAVTGLGVVLAFMVKNLTDDFTDGGTMAAFSLVTGALLAWSEQDQWRGVSTLCKKS